MVNRVKEALEAVVGCFESAQVPDAVAYSMFPIPNLPSAKWSFLNRITIFLSGTVDARGYRQWKSVNRYVKKGAKAIHILVPRMVKREMLNEEGESEGKEALMGFMAKAVFRVEDTDGVPLDYMQLELPSLPLIERAQEWGISVKSVPGNYQYYGYFCQKNNEIGLASRDESVFFHELSHAAHQRVAGDLKKLPSWEKEVVAELAAAALCRMVGKASKYIGNSFQYIRHYAEGEGLSPVKACLRVISDVEKVLGLIVGADGDESAQEDPVGLEGLSMVRGNTQGETWVTELVMEG